MVHQPVHPYVSEGGWVDYHRAIAEAVPELGVVPYIRNPVLAGARLAELADACPNVIGVKYAVPDAARFAAFARDAGLERFVWVAGLAEPYAPSYFSAGATGFTSGLVNVAPAVSLNMIEALRSGDYAGAMKVWEQIRRFEELRGANGSANNVTVVKEALASLGLCRRDVRPPSRQLPESERAEVAAIAGGGPYDRRQPIDVRGRTTPRRGAAVAQSPVVRHRGPALLQPPGPHPAARLPPRGAPRQAGHRDPEHLVRHQPLPRPSAGPRPGGQAGCVAGRRLPLEFPVSTLSETFQKPTPMLYRNMLAMETEELLRSYPVDGAVLMGGCDKSTPALLMGAASVDLPTVFVPAGPMLPGHWRNEILGSGTDMWKYWDDKRAGLIGDCEMTELESGLARSPGHCMTMGTASTLTAAAEALGVTVPGASSIPAVDSGHDRMAAASGLRIVELVRKDRKLSDILTQEAFEDAVTTVLGLGGSTNAVIHLIAMAGRAGARLTLDDFDRIARTVPVLANVRPGGRTYLMEDFHFAGGLPGFLSRITDLLHLDRPTVSHDSLREQLATAQVHNDEVIRTRENPVAAEGGVAVLRGNLCPDGAVIKHISAEPHLLKHTGPAVVFDDYRAMQRTINDPELGITADTVLVLRNSGPKGGPGMPEYGMLPIPDHLLKQGVRDMVRISDARMSGTSYGACVLHVAPESYIGGPLALVRTGDTITLDVEARSLQLNVDDAELERRRERWTAPPERYERGYGALYNDQITQADTGCDFAFLARPGKVPDPYAG